MTALGLRCCTRVLSSCREQRLPSSCGVQASLCSGFSCRAWVLGAQASVCGAWALEHRLSSCAAHGLSCPGSSWTRNQTCVLCIARWIPNHWTTREALRKFLRRKLQRLVAGSGLAGLKWQGLRDFGGS